MTDKVEFEYRTTTGTRKVWDGDPDLTTDGWEEYKPWERFEYYEERYWRRPIKHPICDRLDKIIALLERLLAEDSEKAE